jgi:hypothetical protein
MIWLAVIATAVALLTGCSGGKSTASQPPPSGPSPGSTTNGLPNLRQLTDLRNIDQLRSLFNTRSGEPRLILLASPT